MSQGVFASKLWSSRAQTWASYSRRNDDSSSSVFRLCPPSYCGRLRVQCGPAKVFEYVYLWIGRRGRCRELESRVRLCQYLSGGFLWREKSWDWPRAASTKLSKCLEKREAPAQVLLAHVSTRPILPHDWFASDMLKETVTICRICRGKWSIGRLKDSGWKLTDTFVKSARAGYFSREFLPSRLVFFVLIVAKLYVG